MATRNKDVAAVKSKPAAAPSTATAGSATSTPSSEAAPISASASAASKLGRSGDRAKGATTTTSTAPTAANGSTNNNTNTSAMTVPIMTTSSTAASVKPLGSDIDSSSRRPSPSVLSENAPPSTQVDTSICVLCGTTDGDAAAENLLMACRCCGSAFHARCANLPQTPEEGEFFCRWDCFTAFRKSQGAPPKTPLGDFSRLAEHVQSILGALPRRGGPPSSMAAPQTQSLTRGGMDNQERVRGDRSKQRGLPHHHAPNGRSRSPSQLTSRVPGERPSNGYGGGGGGERCHPDELDLRRPISSSRSLAQGRVFGGHVDLTGDDMEPPAPPVPRSPRSRPISQQRVSPGRPPLDDLPFDDAEESRGKRPKYLPPDDPMAGGGGGGRRFGPSRRGSGGGAFPTNGSGSGGGNDMLGMGGLDSERRQIFVPPDNRGRGGGRPVGSARLPSIDGDHHSSRSSSARSSSRPGSARDTYKNGARPDEYDGGTMPPPPPSATGPVRSRPPSAEYRGDKATTGPHGAPSHTNTNSGGNHRNIQMQMATGPPPQQQQQQQPPPATKYNIPWLNPAAFPYGLRERFNCRPDNINGVFHIDLTPVFGDKTMHLYQSEIDFFFRCFESADVSLVVKGMASELNQYIWAWPFILESCGSETHFSFDHFQFRHQPGELPELEYVGELRLSMASYNAYLERYLSGSMVQEVVVLEDHVTKKPITLVAAENIIALNELRIADHCAQLYNDLIKSFQWDVFAGGIHCLLQYLPQASRHKRFASPLLHFNFPGARGRLRDPGNGTTDQAYQVLVGSLELVIFERLEPKDRDAFHRVLHSAGYDPDKKAMLLDSHLRVLRDAGFAWSTVLLSDGDFVHVNKGRLHFWRVVETETVARAPCVTSPCVFLSWEWVYQGVSQRGISTECWFAMKNVSLCTGGWAFDPRRAIVEAAKCGVAIVRTGQFLHSLSAPSAPPILLQLAFTSTSPAAIDRDVVTQRQEQMVLFLESILPCMDAIVEEEFELGLVKDDSADFRKIFDDEAMWKSVDTALSARHPLRNKMAEYDCGICGLELTNIYKQCLGCTVHARRSRPNVAYQIFRICLRCHAQPEHHHYKPHALHGFYEKLCSSEGHTGLLPATRRYQSERSYFKCRCAPYVRCTYCGGCESCCCLCHTLFQTRFRYTSPEHLDHLRTDVVDLIKWHKQQLLQQQHER